MKHEARADRAVFIQCLRAIPKAVKGIGEGKAKVHAEEDVLRISLRDCEIEGPFIGQWEGTVTLTSRFFDGLYRRLPAGDPIRISVQDEVFQVGEPPSFLRVACTASLETEPVLSAADMPLWRILWARHSHSVDELERQGLVRRLWEAEVHRDELIHQASVVLFPLGVGLADLQQLVTRVLKERNTPSGGA